MYGPSPYETRVEDEVKICFVTNEIVCQDQLVFDSEDGNWFTKGMEVQYNDLMASLKEWSLEEKQDNLKRLLTK